MGWMERIADADDREQARDVFEEWLQMKADIHDEIEFTGRQNDVGTLLIDTDDNHRARDLTQHYTGNPVRVHRIDGADRGVVQLKVLLANLTTDDSVEP